MNAPAAPSRAPRVQIAVEIDAADTLSGRLVMASNTPLRWMCGNDVAAAIVMAENQRYGHESAW